MRNRPPRVHYVPATPDFDLDRAGLCGRVHWAAGTSEPTEVTCEVCQQRLQALGVP